MCSTEEEEKMMMNSVAEGNYSFYAKLTFLILWCYYVNRILLTSASVEFQDTIRYD
jgi:hypothetical protein